MNLLVARKKPIFAFIVICSVLLATPSVSRAAISDIKDGTVSLYRPMLENSLPSVVSFLTSFGSHAVSLTQKVVGDAIVETAKEVYGPYVRDVAAIARNNSADSQKLSSAGASLTANAFTSFFAKPIHLVSQVVAPEESTSLGIFCLFNPENNVCRGTVALPPKQPATATAANNQNSNTDSNSKSNASFSQNSSSPKTTERIIERQIGLTKDQVLAMIRANASSTIVKNYYSSGGGTNTRSLRESISSLEDTVDSLESSTNRAIASSSQWITNGTNVHYSSGRVGIGTSSPVADLSVSGAVKVTGTSTFENLVTINGQNITSDDPTGSASPTEVSGNYMAQENQNIYDQYPTNLQVTQDDDAGGAYTWPLADWPYYPGINSISQVDDPGGVYTANGTKHTYRIYGYTSGAGIFSSHDNGYYSQQDFIDDGSMNTYNISVSLSDDGWSDTYYVVKYVDDVYVGAAGVSTGVGGFTDDGSIIWDSNFSEIPGPTSYNYDDGNYHYYVIYGVKNGVVTYMSSANNGYYTYADSQGSAAPSASPYNLNLSWDANGDNDSYLIVKYRNYDGFIGGYETANTSLIDDGSIWDSNIGDYYYQDYYSTYTPQNHDVRIYTYTDTPVNDTKVFSDDYITGTHIGPEDSSSYGITWDWDDVAGVDGYRVYIYSDLAGYNYDYYYDVTESEVTDEGSPSDNGSDSGLTTSNTDRAISVAGTANFGSGNTERPGISFVDDVDTGLMLPTVDTLAFVTAGTERMRLTSGGNLGIGTTSPLARLSVKGAGTGTGVTFTTTNSNNTRTLTVLDNGSIGIGTTSPAAKLSLSGGDMYFHQDGTTANYAIRLGPQYGGPKTGIIKWFNVGGEEGLLMDTWASGYQFRMAGSKIILGVTEGGVSQGNVGIGTTSPLAKLSVKGAGTGTGVTLTTTNSSNSRTFTILDNGNVGIGVSIPLNKLHLSGGDCNTCFSSATIALGHSSTGQYPNFIHTRHNSGTSANNAIDFYTSDGTAAGVYPTNAVHGLSITAGKVGIGITDPVQELDIAGDISLGRFTTSGSRYIGFTGAGNEVGVNGFSGIQIESVNAPAPYSSNYSQKIHFWTHHSGAASAVQRMTIQYDGNVGIGSTTPSEKLVVNGNINATNLFAFGNNNYFGGSSGNRTMSGAGNVAFGPSVLISNTSGNLNVGMGMAALGVNTTGSNNVALGSQALGSNISGSDNTVIGKTALSGATSTSNNTAVGSRVLEPLTTGTRNTGVGAFSFFWTVSGSNNTGLGYSSGWGNVTGSDNVFVGSNSGGSTSATGTSLTCIGSSTCYTGSGTGLSNATAIGYNTQITTSNTLILGNGVNVGIGTTDPQKKLHVYTSSDDAPVRFEDSNGYCEINPTSTSWTCSSDERLKKNIDTLSSSDTLSRLRDLRSVTFNWIRENDSDNRHQGFIAQEVEDIFPDFVTTDERGYKSVAYGSFTPILVSAIQELDLKVSSLETLLGVADELIEESEGSVIQKVSAMFGKFEKIETKILCLEDICINKDQLRTLLEKADIAIGDDEEEDPESEDTNPEEQDPEEQEPEETATTTEDVDPEENSTPEPEIIPETQPEEATPEPQVQEPVISEPEESEEEIAAESEPENTQEESGETDVSPESSESESTASVDPEPAI